MSVSTHALSGSSSRMQGNSRVDICFSERDNTREESPALPAARAVSPTERRLFSSGRPARRAVLEMGWPYIFERITRQSAIGSSMVSPTLVIFHEASVFFFEAVGVACMVVLLTD